MTWMQSLNGNAIELVSAREANPVDFREIAEALAKLSRFAGNTQGAPYSVGQHSVVVADAIFAETNNPRLAAYGLLHDGKEAWIGEIITPVKSALAALIGNNVMARAWAALEDPLDAAIHRAAGLKWPMADFAAEKVREFDLRAAKTERLHLMAQPPKDWHPLIELAEPLPLRGKLTPWIWARAYEEFLDRLKRYAPEAL